MNTVTYARLRCIIAALVVSAVAPAATYNAITSQAVHEKPPLPASGPGSPGFGAAGTIYQDLVFGSNIVRVTDPSITNGSSWHTYSGSYVNTWATDDAAFLVQNQDNGATALFLFSPSTLQSTFAGYLPISGAIFSFRSPHVIYGIGGADGATIVAYDYTTQAQRMLLDLQVVQPFSQYVGAVTVSADDAWLGVAFGGIQDTHPYAVAYNQFTARTHLMNIPASTIDGVATNIPLSAGSGVHSMQMAMGGDYLEVAIQGIPIVDWQLSSSQLLSPSAYMSGHIALGYSGRVNQGGFVAGDGSTDSRGFYLRPFANMASYSELITNQPASPYSWGEDGHWSWVNDKRSTIGYHPPFCGSFYSQYQPPAAWQTWFDEIVCVAADGSGTVWRMAHHRSIYTGDFWTSPRGNLSQDGKYFVFTSNWDETLSSDGNRTDVFLVDLTSAHQ